VDLGERADIWNRPKGQPTCLAPNSTTPTRRDYVFANAEALQLIVDFEVRPQQHFPVHSFLRVTFRPPKGDRYFWHNFRPDNLTNSFDKFCAANPAENANSTDTEDKCGKDRRLEHLSTFHHRLDRGFSEARPALLDMLASQDTDSYWQTWNNVVEHAFCRAYNLQGKQGRNSKGRGQTTIRKQKVTKPTLNVDGDVIDEDLCNSELTLLRRQLSRCKQWIARLKIPDGDSRLATYHALNAQASELISRDIHKDDSVALEISQSFPAILANPMDHPRHRIQLMRLCQHYEKCISAKQAELQSEKATKNRANDFEQDTHHAKAYRFLSAQTSPPITYLRRSVTGPCGEAPGTFATEPAEIDKILIDAWSNIYNGTKETFESLVENFCSRFQHLLYIRDEEQQDPIDPQRFMDSCMEANNSAGGMDGWDPIDFKLLNLTAFTYLTDLLNHIEQGGHWPTGLRHGRLVFLAKDASEVEEPLSYRPLLILPHLYRRWAAYRLHTLEPWVRKWANSSMFAGVPQQGAEDAWWLTSVTLETWEVQHVPYSGSSADIAKCFDQVVRPLLYMVAKLAGMPTRVLDPYTRFMEGVSVYNTIGRGVGQPYTRRCGIPQGCPMSMMLIALLLRPWTIAMDTVGVIPRILADDLLILSWGEHHLQSMRHALDMTHDILHSMGAKVAPKKSYLFTNAAKARRWYAGHIWKGLDTTIPLVKSDATWEAR
jgi:hypothetical protein